MFLFKGKKKSVSIYTYEKYLYVYLGLKALIWIRKIEYGEHAELDRYRTRHQEVENLNVIDDIEHITLANTKKNTGGMAYILEKIYNASTETSGEPSQGRQVSQHIVTARRADKV